MTKLIFTIVKSS